MKPIYKILTLVLLLFISLPIVPFFAQNTLADTAKASNRTKVTIGVLAFNGKPQAFKRWLPTADYLSQQIPDYSFHIKPLTHEEFQHAINKEELDFLLTNPGHYVQLEVKAGATRLATFKTRYQQQVLTKMSSVIFTRKDQNIQSLDDLRGKTVVAVSPQAFGGFQLAKKVFLMHQIDTSSDLKLKWLGFPHADVVRAVIASKAGAGIVRAGVLEKMQREGDLDLSSLHILNEKNSDDFPFKHSTSLYPEWPLARLPSTDSGLSKQVILALLQMPENSKANLASGGAGWTIPLDYTSVHELFKVLQIDPYPPIALNWRDFWRAYQPWIIITFTLLLFSILMLLRMLKVNNRLNAAQQSLLQHQDRLEETVTQRTDELLQTNQALQQDIEARIAIEEDMHDACDTLQGLYMIGIRHDLSREQRLQSILDMARLYLGSDWALLSRWDDEQQQFSFCTASPEGQTMDIPLSTESALQAITENKLQVDQLGKQWGSYLACPVKLAERYQCLFEFVTLQPDTVDNNAETNEKHSLLTSEIHQRILHLLTLWIGNEMALIETENRTNEDSRVLRQRFSDISPREREVLNLLVLGESNKSMARHLNISPKTIELHRANLLKKTQAKSSIELVKMAIQSGLT